MFDPIAFYCYWQEFAFRRSAESGENRRLRIRLGGELSTPNKHSRLRLERVVTTLDFIYSPVGQKIVAEGPFLAFGQTFRFKAYVTDTNARLPPVYGKAPETLRRLLAHLEHHSNYPEALDSMSLGACIPPHSSARSVSSHLHSVQRVKILPVPGWPRCDHLPPRRQ